MVWLKLVKSSKNSSDEVLLRLQCTNGARISAILVTNPQMNQTESICICTHCQVLGLDHLQLEPCSYRRDNLNPSPL